jgi:hypothetical protein
MTVQAIKAHLNTAPFVPFRLLTASGHEYLVKHPDFITFSPAGMTCQVYADDGEYYTSLATLTITEAVPEKKMSRRKK